MDQEAMQKVYPVYIVFFKYASVFFNHFMLQINSSFRLLVGESVYHKWQFNKYNTCAEQSVTSTAASQPYSIRLLETGCSSQTG